MESDAMNPYLISVIALACALPLVWWLARRGTAPQRPEQPADRLDTLAGWPPETMRVLRSSERLAFSTLKLALPGYMILAQVPIARFIAVPKRNSYAEWMRRIGSQCVDFIVCDVTSQVVAVVEIRPPPETISDKLRTRLERVARTLKATQIPLHVWNEERLPSIDAARDRILPDAPAVPANLARRSVAQAQALPELSGIEALGGASEATAGPTPLDAQNTDPGANPFADTDRDWTHSEVIEVREPNVTTWFDELDEPVTPELPAQRKD